MRAGSGSSAGLGGSGAGSGGGAAMTAAHAHTVGGGGGPGGGVRGRGRANAVGGARGGISEAALQKMDKTRQELGAAKDPLDESAHELRKGYCSLIEDVLFSDLEFALGRKLEQDLWNVAFRAAISALQKDSSTNTESALKLGLMIDLSAGYFLQLLQRLIQRYRVTELKIMPGPDCLGVMDVQDDLTRSEHDHVRIAKRSRVLYICQYCLVHLGDLARYRHDLALAENYYRQAASVDPRNGHPYNQLGLLEGAKGCRLATVFLYVRALSVSHPFVVAITNLEKIYSKLIQDEQSTTASSTTTNNNDSKSSDSRLAPAELTAAFLYFIGLVHLNQQMALAKKVLSKLMASLPRLVCGGKLDEQTLLQMTTIALYTFNRSNKHSSMAVHRKPTSESQLLDAADGGAKIMSEFVFGLFRCVLLANVSSTIVDNPAMATALVLLETLVANPKSVSINPVKDVWYVLRTVLNSFVRQLTLDWKDEALPEDFELRGFVPLRMVQSKLRFADRDLTRAQAAELRVSRFVKQGKELCRVKFLDGSAIISYVDGDFRAKECTTEDDLVRELERIRLDKEEPRPTAVRFSAVDDEAVEARRDKPSKRQNVALQAIMNQRQAAPAELGSAGPGGSLPFSQPPPPLVGVGAGKWNFPSPAVPPPPAALMHPSGTYPMTIEELVKQPPPPIYNVDLRLVPPPSHSLPRPQQAAQPTSMGFGQSPASGPPMVQPNTYSLFSGGSWNPQMGPLQMGVHAAPRPHLLGALSAPGVGNAPRPQGGSLWKPDKGPQGTSALERLLKETKKSKDP